MRQTFDNDIPERAWEITVTVNERPKNAFRATVVVGEDQRLVYEAKGSIRQNTIEWSTIDATIKKGTAGRHRYSGKISNRNRLDLHFSGTTPDFLGTAGIGSAVLQEP
jgi:hypothetical protein